MNNESIKTRMSQDEARLVKQATISRRQATAYGDMVIEFNKRIEELEAAQAYPEIVEVYRIERDRFIALQAEMADDVSDRLDKARRLEALNAKMRKAVS